MTNEERNLLSSDPYPGLRPYHEDEQDKFFGRDADAEVLIDKVLTNRLTLLFAASGVGKSSLLQAAVIPRLKSPTGENLEVVYHIDWVSEPVSSVRAAVLQALHSSGKLPEGAADEAGETLEELLEFCGLFVRHPLVLILDQFEEFFRYQRASANFQPFIEQLTAIITNPQLPVSLVLSMREDFALELNAFKPRLPTLLFENFYRLDTLSKKQAYDAVVNPMSLIGFYYEDGLVDVILNDLLISPVLLISEASPDLSCFSKIEMSYLQIVCSYLWSGACKNNSYIVKVSDYFDAGAAEGILERYLEHKFGYFQGREKYIAYRAFDFLVGLSGFKIAYTAEGLSKVTRMPEKNISFVLDKLDKLKVLRKSNIDGFDWYQLHHDIYSRLIRNWQCRWRISPEYVEVASKIDSHIVSSYIVFDKRHGFLKEAYNNFLVKYGRLSDQAAKCFFYAENLNSYLKEKLTLVFRKNKRNINSITDKVLGETLSLVGYVKNMSVWNRVYMTLLFVAFVLSLVDVVIIINLFR
ncbi:ATP-binding protein [Candidatus Thiothrix anitrata]|uniref:ATP-binding protein n=1 Tax=Candidatus Thiothrix anitrata TaxID=2823902 RepID=A0ABX7X2E7_9GAMM|nr:ATP-binding protein [Candidatus Thiothrix anitrata]QTR50059.1 ATP-binding protein [Candidatus Thiothrix anitrata]